MLKDFGSKFRALDLIQMLKHVRSTSRGRDWPRLPHFSTRALMRVLVEAEETLQSLNEECCQPYLSLASKPSTWFTLRTLSIVLLLLTSIDVPLSYPHRRRCEILQKEQDAHKMALSLIAVTFFLLPWRLSESVEHTRTERHVAVQKVIGQWATSLRRESCSGQRFLTRTLDCRRDLQDGEPVCHAFFFFFSKSQRERYECPNGYVQTILVNVTVLRPS